MRITEKNLESVLDRLNAIHPEGKYELEQGYAGNSKGWKLCHNSGSSDTFRTGYLSKSALWDLMQAYILGLEVTK